jgi:hypothetical protein
MSRCSPSCSACLRIIVCPSSSSSASASSRRPHEPSRHDVRVHDGGCHARSPQTSPHNTPLYKAVSLTVLLVHPEGRALRAFNSNKVYKIGSSSFLPPSFYFSIALPAISPLSLSPRPPSATHHANHPTAHGEARGVTSGRFISGRRHRSPRISTAGAKVSVSPIPRSLPFLADATWRLRKLGSDGDAGQHDVQAEPCAGASERESKRARARARRETEMAPPTHHFPRTTLRPLNPKTLYPHDPTPFTCHPYPGPVKPQTLNTKPSTLMLPP